MRLDASHPISKLKAAPDGGFPCILIMYFASIGNAEFNYALTPAIPRLEFVCGSWTDGCSFIVRLLVDCWCDSKISRLIRRSEQRTGNAS